MNQKQFYQELLAVSGPGTITLQPGPIKLRVNEHDAMAARSLLWMYDQMPEKTVGDLLDVLDSMRWWVSFWNMRDDYEELPLSDEPEYAEGSELTRFRMGERMEEV
jgi:hypothetical protein